MFNIYLYGINLKSLDSAPLCWLLKFYITFTITDVSSMLTKKTTKKKPAHLLNCSYNLDNIESYGMIIIYDDHQ